MLKKESFSSPLGVFIIYVLASALAIMGFRFIFPGEAAPLAHFSVSWRLIRGLLEFIGLFPALAFSALVIPFGLKIHAREKIAPFSPQFLQFLKLPIFTAIVAAGLFSLLIFLVLPLARDYEANLRFQSQLYRFAKEEALKEAAGEEWVEAAQFLAICERIWPGGPEHAKLKTEADIRTEQKRLSQEPPLNARAVASRTGLPGPQPPNVTEALALAETALAEERYFEAHWLATLGGRLAKPDSVEMARARRLAGRAWSGVNSLAPNIRETKAYNIYRLKREGYEALNTEEWIRAYYIFRELLDLSPDDPDAHKYLALSEEGVKQVAFFIDEMELTLGKILTGAVFSLPMNSGRLVMRIASLSTFPDSAYCMGVEMRAFDRDGRPLWSMETPYVKIFPLVLASRGGTSTEPQSGEGSPLTPRASAAGSGPGLVVLLRSLDRTDKNRRWEPVVRSPGQNAPSSIQITLPVSWENFLLLSNIHRGLSSLSPADLKRAAENLGSCGYQAQVFETELIRRFAEPLLLLPLGIFAIVIGWRYRALKRSRYMGILMLGILPLVFNGAVNLCRGWVYNLGILAVVSLGFTAAAVIFAAGITVLLVLFLIMLAAQHG